MSATRWKCDNCRDHNKDALCILETSCDSRPRGCPHLEDDDVWADWQPIDEPCKTCGGKKWVYGIQHSPVNCPDCTDEPCEVLDSEEGTDCTTVDEWAGVCPTCKGTKQVPDDRLTSDTLLRPCPTCTEEKSK